MSVEWKGVMPAITTPFLETGEVDHGFLAEHARWLIAAGCTGLIPLGSLGEGQALDVDEKRSILVTLVEVCDDKIPVIPGIGATSTHQAVGLARMAQDCGCSGLMVLPPYVHRGSNREYETHLETVIEATDLPCMLYNNPAAYGHDLSAKTIVEMAENHSNLVAVKDSSGDVRRITAITALADGAIDVFVGLDDCVVEGVRAGATGWVAGLVNALPRDSIALFEAAAMPDRSAADSLYRWFLPLLRMDCVPEFVQLIKLVQEEVGRGSSRVRPPRLPLMPAAKEEARALIREALSLSKEGDS